MIKAFFVFLGELIHHNWDIMGDLARGKWEFFVTTVKAIWGFLFK